MRADAAPYARQCCPTAALRALTPAELRALDAYCRRGMSNPDAEPQDGDEVAAVERYHALLAERAHGWWREGWGR